MTLDWLRVYLLAVALPANPYGILCVSVFYICVAYGLMLIFRTVTLRKRADLRAKISLRVGCVMLDTGLMLFLAQVFLVFPLYKVIIFKNQRTKCLQ